jgi:hypothetical protein
MAICEPEPAISSTTPIGWVAFSLRTSGSLGASAMGSGAGRATSGRGGARSASSMLLSGARPSGAGAAPGPMPCGSCGGTASEAA